MKHYLTKTQLDWLVMALNHHIAEVRAEMDSAPDDSPAQSLGEMFISGRSSLLMTLTDIINGNAKTIGIK